MELILENFHILLILGIAFAAWLKGLGGNKEEEEAERQAREEMIRHLQELDERPAERPAQRSGPPPVPQKWDTRPQAASQPEVKPPPLKAIFQEIVQQLEPPPIPQQEQRVPSAYDEEPAPWDFEHVDASHSEITDTPDPNDELLDRQRNMQERLAELKRQAEESKGQVGGARATQRRASTVSHGEIGSLPPIAKVLKDRSQTRRAIILNEILDKPIGLRGMG